MGSGARELVDRYPGQKFVVVPRIGICPIVEFFVDPGQERDWGVSEGVAKGLRFGGMELSVCQG
jgi:hypothetical protein